MLSINYIQQIAKHYAKMFNTSIDTAGAIVDYDKSNVPHAMIFVASPSCDMPYYKLGTIGMSDYRQKGYPHYSELIMLLPNYWNLDSKETRWQWPIDLLQLAVKAPYATNSPIGYYHSFALNDKFETFDSSTDKSVVVFTPLKHFDRKLQSVRIGLKKVHFMQMLPINHFTYDAINKPNRRELIDKLMQSDQFSYIFC